MDDSCLAVIPYVCTKPVNIKNEKQSIKCNINYPQTFLFSRQMLMLLCSTTELSSLNGLHHLVSPFVNKHKSLR